MPSLRKRLSLVRKLSQEIDKITKRVEKIGKPQKTKTVELREVPEIDPAILARAIRGKVYPNDIVLAHIISNPDGIEILDKYILAKKIIVMHFRKEEYENLANDILGKFPDAIFFMETMEKKIF